MVIRSKASTNPDGERLFLELLRVADDFQFRDLARALFDPATFRIFMR
jgi:hypothetical protein